MRGIVKGGNNEGGVKDFFGKYVGTELTLVPQVSSGQYVYSNEDVQVVLDTPTETPVDRSTAVKISENNVTQLASTRTLVRLSNGWFVSFATPGSTCYWMVSKDNGATWSQLCYSTSIDFASLVAYGTKVYTISHRVTTVRSFAFDATTVANVDINSTAVTLSVAGGVTGVRPELSIAVNASGHLTVAWAYTNNSDPEISYYNIRTAKSVNGGVTWTTHAGVAGSEQITFLSSNQRWARQPQVVYCSDGYPAIVYLFERPGQDYTIYSNKFNGTAWQTGGEIPGTLLVISAYPVVRPAVCVDKFGNMHVVVEFYSSTFRMYVYYYKSTNNGATWSSFVNLTLSESAYNQKEPSISSDKDGKVFVVFTGVDPSINTTRDQVREIIFNGSTWSAIFTRTALSTASATDMCAVFADFSVTFDRCPHIRIESARVYFSGKWLESSSIQSLPSVNNASTESDMAVLGAGVLKTKGVSLKRYVGYVSSKAKGWS